MFRDLWQQSKSAFKEKKLDVHTQLMRKYKQVPEYWFTCILVVNIAATIFICEYYKEQLQLPWWGVLIACALAFFFTLPLGVITATANQVRLHCYQLILIVQKVNVIRGLQDMHVLNRPRD